jgi:hypothetical protein
MTENIYYFTKKAKMAFVGNKDVDKTILLSLNDFDLSNVCQTNTYFRSLCSEDSFWRIKTYQRFGKYLKDVSQLEKYIFQYSFNSWKSYYISLIDFLEKKYLGYFVPMRNGSRKLIGKYEDYRNAALKREDIRKLNNAIDDNDKKLYENIRKFSGLIGLDHVLRKCDLDKFLDKELGKDMLNPSSILIEIINLPNNSENILAYFLNSKDRRIHPEYFDNELLKLTIFDEYYKGFEGQSFKMVLKDSRVDPNPLLDQIASNANINSDITNLVLKDPRIQLDNIQETITEYLENPNSVYLPSMLKVFEAFLEKGGQLSELEYIINNIENRDEGIIAYYGGFIEEQKNPLHQQIISKLFF